MLDVRDMIDDRCDRAMDPRGAIVVRRAPGRARSRLLSRGPVLLAARLATRGGSGSNGPPFVTPDTIVSGVVARGPMSAARVCAYSIVAGVRGEFTVDAASGRVHVSDSF
jgi:hypothetical protein